MLSSKVNAVTFNPLFKLFTNVIIRGFSSDTELPKFETIALSVPKKHVYHVEFNRPQKLNTFNHTMCIEITKCFQLLSENPECRVVIVSAQGKHFTAGIDLNSLMSLGSKANEIDDVARKARYFQKFIETYQNTNSSMETCVKPVINVIHSACVGFGVNFITAADIRYCTSDAWFTVKEVDVGLAPDVGALQRLPKVIGNASAARELCLTARKFDAKEALELGLVSKVLQDKETALQHALETASNIASKSPVAVQTTKQNLVYSQSRPVEDGLLHIRLLNQTMLQSEDLVKSAIAQATKSDPPEFDNY